MTAPAGSGQAVQRAKRGVYVAFGASGVLLSTWASRIPQVRDELDLTPAALGLVLLAIAVGSLLALPSAGLVVHRLGAAGTITAMSLVATAGLATAGAGVLVGVAPVVVGLLLLGFGNGAWDVAMNVEAAAVEQHLGRSIMSRFHAGFSIGTVLGAMVGAGANALGLPVTAHLVSVAVLVAVAVRWAATGFLPAGTQQHDEHRDGERHPLHAWTEPRTVLIGLFVLTVAFAEGTGNDWLGVAAIDGYGASAALGSLAYVLFVASMTVVRWFGSGLLDRFGRVLVLRMSAACGLLGVLVVVLGPGLAAAMAGTVLWGAGAALGFPVGMSAAADEPGSAAGRVSVVATIGYVAFLAGPAVIGLVGNRTGVLEALSVTAALFAVGFALAGVTRPIGHRTADR